MKKLLLNLVSFLFVALAFASCSSDGDDGMSPESVQLDQAESRAAQQMQTFDYDYLKACSMTMPTENIAVSPLSARLFLSMLANSLEGEAVNEIASALNTTDLEAVNTLSQKLQAYLPQADHNVKVAIANSVWYHDDLKINKLFEQNAQRYYHAELYGTDFTRPDAGSRINSWIKKNTGGLIDNFFTNGSLSSESAVMLNTLYYKGEWVDKFDKTQTSKETFHGIKNDAIVEMMHQTFPLAQYYKGSGFQTIKIPMGKQNLFEAVFVLPDEDEKVEALVAQDLIGFIAQETFVSTKVKLAMPKFKLSPGKFSLKKVLEALGIKSLSNSVGKLFEQDVNVGENIFQQAVIEINEEGAEAAAVTGGMDVMHPGASDFIDLTFDRPFVFFIKEKKTGACLFAARVNQL